MVEGMAVMAEVAHLEIKRKGPLAKVSNAIEQTLPALPERRGISRRMTLAAACRRAWMGGQ